jgi:ankyrin repeat protein
MKWLPRMLAAALLCAVQNVPAATPAPVADAVMGNDAARLAALLAAHADVGQAQPDGTTALHWAASRGDAATVRALLKAGAQVDVATSTGMTPLALAANAGSSATIAALLDAGAEVNRALAHGETPLMFASRNGAPDAVELLLKRGAKLDAAENLRGTTALMWAAANSNAAAVRVLLQHGANYRLRSATAARGRGPYLAPPARERIQEFIDGTGLRGAVVDADTPEAKRLFEERVAAAKREVARFDKPAPYAERGKDRWGGLTALIFAAREGDLESARALVAAGADVNQTSEYGWTPLLTATQDRNYQLGVWLLEHGANPNIANKGGWNPLYIATDNRNIEGGDYPTRKPDMDHLQFIEKLLAAGANPNQRMHSSTETRTVFTNQWLYEEGATPFLRAAQSSDLVLIKLLLRHGADPSLSTDHKVTPLMVASGIGWVEGVTFEWSRAANLQTVQFLLDLGADINAQDVLDGRTALMGAAHKGRNEIVQLLVDRGADLSLRDIGSRDSIHVLAGKAWQAVDYADGLVRVGVQSAIAHPDTAKLLRVLMTARHLPVPPEGRTLNTVCTKEVCE